ncbi:hypothetical protein [Halospeciosus flavus]|uniref:Uncharacterized protein n=1 Tax=Halospeciosus flavus TaxID=3032283 RepID=A0ABD5Z3D4_9EURY|nr:hypothetical protein [Halospeciosus flavus]
MKLKLATILMVVVVASATIGASAYTSATLSRTASVDVVNDDAGLIGLADGSSGDLVYNNSGQLAIDFARGSATGANANATFEIGNTADPVNGSAFTITNQDITSHSFTVSYTGAGGTAVTATNIEFQIYDGTGASVGTVSEENTSTTLSGIGSGTTLYVVIVVDTTGLSSADDLSGSLEISA